MRVGFLIYHQIDGRGGLENALLKTVNGLKKQGVDSALFFWESTVFPEFLRKFDDVVVAKPATIKAWPYLPKFIRRRCYKRAQYQKMQALFDSEIIPRNLDALIVIDLPDTLIFFQAILDNYQQSQHVPIISWIHGSLSQSTSKQVRRTQKLLPAFDHHLTVSQGIADELYSLYQITNVTAVHNAVDSAELIPRSGNNQENRPYKLLFIGRVADPRKQVDRLLSALTELRGNWVLDIFGASGSALGDQQFQEKIESLGLAQKVIFHGWSLDPWCEIDSADVLLLNSYSEGFGLVLVEAMMRGIPCVSTNCPVGPDEIIHPDLNGWLFDVGREDEMITLLDQIINETRVLPDALVVQQSVERYQVDHVLRYFKTTLDQLINSR